MHLGGVSGASNHFSLDTAELGLKIREGLKILLALPVTMVEHNHQELAFVVIDAECRLSLAIDPGDETPRSRP